MKFDVIEGEYPFNKIIGRIEVQDRETPEQTAEAALLEAVEKFGGHPVVQPVKVAH